MPAAATGAEPSTAANNEAARLMQDATARAARIVADANTQAQRLQAQSVQERERLLADARYAHSCCVDFDIWEVVHLVAVLGSSGHCMCKLENMLMSITETR